MLLIEMNSVLSMPFNLQVLAVSLLHISPNGGTLRFSRFFFRFMMFEAANDLYHWDSFQQYTKETQ